MSSRHREIAPKYDVDAAVALPDLLGLPKVVKAEQVLASTLEAVYADTDDLALAGAGIALRRRTGALDAGWQLQLFPGGNERAEPIGTSHADDIPPQLLGQVRAWVRGRTVHQVATLTTVRLVHRLLGEAGKVLAEISDDMVTATATASAATTTEGPEEAAPPRTEDLTIASTWREWEVELVNGSPKLLAATVELFTKAGAVASVWPSKLHHALEQQPRQRPPLSSEVTDQSTAGAALNAYLAEQVTVILTRDHGVQLGESNAVHKMRVATRRFRSALSTFRPLVDRQLTDPIRDELKWLAGLLGGARDAEVQLEHLQQALSAEPDDLVLGPVAARLQVELGSDHRRAQDALAAALETSRYFQLLDTLEILVAAPPFTELAANKAGKVLRERLSHVCQDLYARVSTGEPEIGESRDVWLHDVRKSAKRVRYAAEAAEPALGKRARTLIAAATQVQEVLGDHQDSVVIRATLRDIGARMFLDGENAFTMGRLHALEQVRAGLAEAEFTQLWSTLVAEQLRGWLRR